MKDVFCTACSLSSALRVMFYLYLLGVGSLKETQQQQHWAVYTNVDKLSARPRV